MVLTIVLSTHITEEKLLVEMEIAVLREEIIQALIKQYGFKRAEIAVEVHSALAARGDGPFQKAFQETEEQA